LAKPSTVKQFKQAQNSPAAPVTPTPPSATPGSEAPPILSPGTITPPAGSPATGNGVTPSQPIGPAKQGAAPDYLNSNPNPLTIPTRPEDVRVRGIQPITLQQAVELAKRNNRELQIATLQLQRTRAVLRETQAALYPTVGTDASIVQQGSTQQNQTPAGPIQQNDSRTTFDGGLTLNYNIYTAGQRPAQIRAAEQQVRSDQLEVEVAEQRIRLDVATAYYNLQEADEAVRIQQAAVRNAEASLRDTQAQERAGLGTRFDVLQSQVQLANAQQDLTNALATQRTRRRELVRVLAVPVYIDLAAADPVEIAGSWNLTLPQSIVLAVKNRAELEQQLAQREIAEQRRRAALGSLWPTVNLRVRYGFQDNLRDGLQITDNYSVSLGTTWNFFDGGAARAQARQQEINKSIAETSFAQARENIQLEVESSFTNLQSTFLNIGTNRQAVAQAREALRLARLRFQAGVGIQTEVINAENALTRAEGNLVTAIIGYNRALASLQRAVTNLPIPTGSTTPSIPGPAPALPPEQPF
jgi:OMF family outer membrane factor